MRPAPAPAPTSVGDALCGGRVVDGVMVYPRALVQRWTPREAALWLRELGFAALAKSLTTISGEGLLRLGEGDLSAVQLSRENAAARPFIEQGFLGDLVKAHLRG